MLTRVDGDTVLPAPCVGDVVVWPVVPSSQGLVVSRPLPGSTVLVVVCSTRQQTHTHVLHTVRVTQSLQTLTRYLLPEWHSLQTLTSYYLGDTHFIVTDTLLPEWHTVYNHWHVTYYQSDTQSTDTDTLLTTSLQTLTCSNPINTPLPLGKATHQSTR